MTPDQRAKKTALARRYAKTTKGRAIFLRKAYQRVDECDLTTEEVEQIIDKACHYCGTTSLPRGLDRIDNSRGHIKGNVLPACAPCNFARGDRFTVDEMMRIGVIIADIFKARGIDRAEARSADHLEILPNYRPK